MAPYENATSEVTISETFDGTIDPDEIANQVASQHLIAKAQVYGELGLDFEQDEVTGRIIELFPGTEVVENHPSAKAAKAAAPKRQGTRPLRPVREEPEEEDEAEDEAPPRRTAPRAPRASAPARKPANRARNRQSNDEDDPFGDWQDLMDNPDDWDYFPDKQGARQPDFRHKTRKQQGSNYKASLWLDSAPSWFDNPYE